MLARRTSRTLRALATVAALVAAGSAARTAHAFPNPEQCYEGAQVVFVGIPIGRRTLEAQETAHSRPRPVFEFTFAVTHVWKGDAPETLQVQTEQRLDCDRLFDYERPWLVYAQLRQGVVTAQCGPCGGPVDRAIWDLRWLGVPRTGRIGHPLRRPSLDELVTDLSSPDWSVRSNAAHALATEREHPDSAIAHLTAVAMGTEPGDPLSAVSGLDDACSGLSMSQGYSKPACKSLLKILRCGLTPARSAALRAFDLAGDCTIRNCDVTETALQDTAPEVLVPACAGVRPRTFCDSLRLTAKAARRLVALLRHPSASVRAAALETLFYSPVLASTIPALLDSLLANDPDTNVRDLAGAVKVRVQDERDSPQPKRIALSAEHLRDHLPTPVLPDSSWSPYDVAAAYEVYAAILPTAWPLRAVNAASLVIRSETRNFHMCLEPDSTSAPLVGPAIADYIRVNARGWLLQRRLRIAKPYELVSDEYLSRFRNTKDRDYWKAFYTRYPESGGWLEFSAVGFNADRTIAVVYMAAHYGWLGGEGSFHVLHKVQGRWEPLQWLGKSCGWVS